VDEKEQLLANITVELSDEEEEEGEEAEEAEAGQDGTDKGGEKEGQQQTERPTKRRKKKKTTRRRRTKVGDAVSRNVYRFYTDSEYEKRV